jgi:hypothetical protein
VLWVSASHRRGYFQAKRWAAELPDAKLIWASPRERLNIFQAGALGGHIITVCFN